jgi:hypothetical protein
LNALLSKMSAACKACASFLRKTHDAQKFVRTNVSLMCSF